MNTKKRDRGHPWDTMAKVRKSHRRTTWARVLEGHGRDSEKSALQKLREVECCGHRTLTKLRENSATAHHRSDSTITVKIPGRSDTLLLKCFLLNPRYHLGESQMSINKSNYPQRLNITQ